MAALKFGVVLQRPPVGQRSCFPAFCMDSVSATQPTFDLNSFVELRGIIVEVQLFGAKAATIWVVV
jgi:hypothetical protein